MPNSDLPTAPVMGHDPVTRVPLCEHGDDAAACQLAHAKLAPSASTLRPTYGAPHDSESLDGCEGLGWDLSWGFRLNVGHDVADDPTSPLTIGASFSDSDQANGIVVREAAPEQLEEFARLLLDIAAKHRRRLASGQQPVGACPDEWQPYHEAGSRPEHCATCSEGRPGTAPNPCGEANG